MRVVVDAWNVLHVQGILPPGLAGIGLAGLGRLMMATRWGRGHLTLACDGPIQPRPQGIPSAIHVIWSGTQEADDIIEGLIDRTTAPRQMLIVSSDNRLKRAAKRRRCKQLGSAEFLRTILDDLAAGHSPNQSPDTHPPDPGTTWEDQFALTSDELKAMRAQADAAAFEDLLPPSDSSPPIPPDPTRPPPARHPADPPPSEATFPAELIKQAMRIARGQ